MNHSDKLLGFLYLILNFLYQLKIEISFLKASSHDFVIYGQIEMINFESCTYFENSENSIFKK